MTKEGSKPRNNDVPPKPRGRSFCCSMFIYTFVFVSGVVVATILPDLAGHHFKQPYGKEYGLMAEKLVQDLPKYLKKFSDTMMVISSELGNQVWALKTEIQKRFNEATKKDEGKAKSAPRSSSSSKSQKSHQHSHSHGHGHDHDHDEEI